MHAFLRHLAVRIWAAVAIGGLLSLWLLPRLQGYFGLQWLVVEVVLIFALCYFLIGRLFRHWADGRISALVQEAAGFERDALTAEASDRYERALNLLDSFLVSPRVRRKLSLPLARRLARFYIARADETAWRNFIPAYLMDQPQDVEVAEFWVLQTHQRGGFKEAHQDLAARIGSAHPDNRGIQRVLARFFMFLERTDYPALSAYRCVWNDTPPPPAEFVRELARLFVRDRRVDEWSLEAYLAALRVGAPRSGLIDALAACVHWIADSPAVHPHLAEARLVLGGMSAEDIEALSVEFRPLASTESFRKKLPERMRRLQRLPVQLAAVAGPVINAGAGHLKSVVRMFHRSARTRRIAAVSFLVLVVTAVGLFAWNTLRHLTGPPAAPAAETIQRPSPEVTDPFTLQVAAYLRLDYAEKYVADLKKRDLDAYWSEAVSGDKKWYQVRISHFASKEAALQLGESLKSRGIIDDYYVANYRAARIK